MEDDVAEGGIGRMAVGFPSLGVGIQFDVTGLEGAFDLHRGLGEVGSRAAVPFAELDDVDAAAVGGAEVAPEGTGKPERLEFEFGGERRIRCLLEGEGRVPDRL